MSHALKAISIHSEDLVTQSQSSILASCPLLKHKLDVDRQVAMFRAFTTHNAEAKTGWPSVEVDHLDTVVCVCGWGRSSSMRTWQQSWLDKISYTLGLGAHCML